MNALKDAVFLTIFCVSVFALIGYQLFGVTLLNKSIRDPNCTALAPPWSTLLVRTHRGMERIGHNVDARVPLLDGERFAALWFQNTKENGDVQTKLDYTPQRRSAFGPRHDTLRWKASDGAIARALIDLGANSTARRGGRIRLPGAWRESALVRATELLLDAGRRVELSGCRCERDDHRCRYSLRSEPACEYKLDEDCQYRLVANTSESCSNSTIDGSAGDVNHLFTRDYCFRNNVPSCDVTAHVTFHRCNGSEPAADDDDEERARDVCGARDMRAPPTVCRRDVDDIARIASAIAGELNSTTTTEINATVIRQHLGTNLTLASILKSPPDVISNVTFDGVTWSEALASTVEQLRNCSPAPVLGGDVYRRSSDWLNGIVAEFRFGVVDGTDDDTEAPTFLYFMPKSFSEMVEYSRNLSDAWKNLEENQARQEPSMGLFFHPGAADRLKLDHQYCILGK